MKEKPEQFSEQQATRRTEAALRAAFRMPHKTYEESKLGKRKASRGGSPDARQGKSQVKKTGR
jgi:hypothetical protein